MLLPQTWRDLHHEVRSSHSRESSRFDMMFLPIPSPLYCLCVANALERVDCCGLVSREYFKLEK